MGLFGFGSTNTTSSTPGDMSVAHSVKVVRGTGSAVALDKVQATSVDLSKKTQAVVDSLAKNNLAGIRAQVMVVLDHSGSMYSNYESGQVQMLVERFLGFGLAVDADGEIPVVAFDHKLHSAVNVNITNYTGIVSRNIYKPSQMGSTDLTKALEKVRDEAKKTDAPLFVAIVTDGEPDDRDSAREIIKDLARYPVFIKFLAVRKVNFLEELDDMSSSERLLDNVDTKAYTDVSSVSDEQFAKDMVDEVDGWIKEATSKGILTV